MNDETKKRAVVKKDANSKSSSFNIHHSTFSYPELLGEIKARVRAGQQRAAMAAHAEMLTTYWDIGRMIAARQEAAGWGAGVLQKLAADLKNELPEEKGFSARNLKLMVQFFHTYPRLDLFGQRTVAPAQSMPEQTEIGQRAVAQLTNEPKTPSVALSQADVVVLSAVTKLSWAHNVKPEYAGKMNFYCSVVDVVLRHPHDAPIRVKQPLAREFYAEIFRVENWSVRTLRANFFLFWLPSPARGEGSQKR